MGQVCDQEIVAADVGVAAAAAPIPTNCDGQSEPWVEWYARMPPLLLLVLELVA